MPADVDPTTTARPRRTTLTLVLAAVLLAVDQVTKVVAVRELTDRPPVEVVGSYLRLVLVYNPGAAFGAGASITPVITVVAIVATVVVLWQAVKVRHVGWAVALGLLLAGVTGNLTDRLLRDPGPFRGHVVDFLALPRWPVFNVADMCINVAAVMLVVLLFRGVRVDGTREGEDPAATPATGADAADDHTDPGTDPGTGAADEHTDSADDPSEDQRGASR